MKPQGLMPDFEQIIYDAFVRFANSTVDQYTLELLAIFSVIIVVVLIFGLNIINNIIHIIKLNIEEFYRR